MVWKKIKNPIWKNKIQIPELTNRDGNKFYTVQQKLESLSEQFLNPPQPENLTPAEFRNFEEVEVEVKELLKEGAEEKQNEAHRLLDRPIVLAEVLKVVRDLKTGKASGPDEVHNVLLKKLPKKAWEELVKTFNACLREGVHPRVWNRANVVPVPKPGKKLDRPAHFRPIAVSSCLGRVLEKVFSDRLQAYCVVRKVFHNNQCGFQPNRRTTDVVSLLLNDARTCLDHNKPCVVTAVDFSKAHDTVWHAGLLFKLSKF